MLQLEQRQSYILENVASDIWQAVIKGDSRTAIIEELSDQYNADRDIIVNDLAEIIKQFTGEGMLQIS